MLTDESPSFLGPECLAPAYTLINSGALKLLSLDVFDTLLFRRCNKPSDVFFYQHQLLKAQQLVPESIAPSEWEKLRIIAEEEARKRVKSACREVILEEIYAYLVEISVIRAEKMVDVIATELTAEAQLIEVDPYISELVLYAAHRGIPYICVSDNYLNEPRLSSLISAAYKKFALPLPAPRTVFVSSEFRESKSHNLFSLVVRQLPFNGHEIVHIGDNYKADSRAKRCKMHFIHYPSSYLWQREIEQMEGEMSAHLEHQSELGSCLMHLRRKVANIYANNDKIHNYSAYGAFVYGPLFYGYGRWCLNKANELNIKKIFCFTREAHLLVPLLKTIAVAHPELEIKPLAVSRHFIQRIAIKTINVSSLLGLFFSETTITGADFFDILGINYEPNPYFESHTLIHRSQLKMLLKWVLSQDHLREAIATLLAQQKASYATYLHSIGFFDEALVAVCDLGWNGTIHRALRQWLKEEKKAVHITGLYLATTTNALKVLSPDDAVCSYLIQYEQPEPLAKALFRSPEVLENITMPAHGSLKNIEGTTPVFSASLLPPIQQQQAQDMQRGILTFVAQITHYYPDSLWGPSPDLNSSPEKQFNQLMLIRSVISPALFEIELFAHWHHEFGLGLKRVSPIIPESEWMTEQFAYKPVSFLCDGHDMHSIYWLGAALTLVGGANLRDLFRLSQLKVISRRLLDEVYINYDPQLKIRHHELATQWQGEAATYDSQPFLLHSLSNFKELIWSVCQIAQVQNIIAIGIESKLFLQELYHYVTSIGSKIIAVDPMLNSELLEELSFDAQFFEAFCGTSAEFFASRTLNRLKGTTLFLLDGDHNYAAVQLELEAIHRLHLAQSSLQPLMFIHDTGWPWGHRDLYYEQGNVSLVDRQQQSALGHGVLTNTSTTFPGSNFHLNDASLATHEGGGANGVMAAIENFLGHYPNYVSWHIPAIFGLNIILPSTLAQIKMIESLIPSWASPLLSRLENNRIEMYLHLIKMNTLIYQHTALEQQFGSLQKKHVAEIEFFRKKLSTETQNKSIKLLKKVKKAKKKISTWWRLRTYNVVPFKK